MAAKGNLSKKNKAAEGPNQALENENAKDKDMELASLVDDVITTGTESKEPSIHTLELHDPSVQSLVGLELPMYSKSMSSVLETVGGLKNLQQTHEAKSQFLAVKLRPKEPSCKPLFADLTKTQTILLRVKRKRTITPDLDVEVVGLVKEKYVCEGMADFQYLTAKHFYPPTELKSFPTTQQAIGESLRPYLHVQDETKLEMIPEVFSKVDLPLKYEFRQRSGYQPTEVTKKTSSTMTYLNFYDDVPAPAAPKPQNPVVRRRPVGANEILDEDVMKKLQDKLEEKPIWLRPTLFEGLDPLERRAARRIVRKLCYVFVDGPWRGTWIRMGYDPRQSPESAKYQVIELRNNRELVHAKVTHPSRKRTKKYSGINPKGPRIMKVTQTSKNENAQASKRRRKERFLRGETRRSFLVDPTTATTTSSSTGSPMKIESHTHTGTGTSAADHSDSEDSDSDSSYHTVKSSTGVSSDALTTVDTNKEKLYEIFGVPLTSANVLFQLHDIDDIEVHEWIDKFPIQEKPSLLGGWFPTHLFLPLREIIRYRIAELVGRSKAELDTRRKQIDLLKKQALSDYADQLANGTLNTKNKPFQKKTTQKPTESSSKFEQTAEKKGEVEDGNEDDMVEEIEEEEEEEEQEEEEEEEETFHTPEEMEEEEDDDDEEDEDDYEEETKQSAPPPIPQVVRTTRARASSIENKVFTF